MNPWITMWLHPRQTIRQIVEAEPTHMVIPLAVMGGVADWLASALVLVSMLQLQLITVVTLLSIGGAVLGIIGLYFFGWMYSWVGSWFGGQAKAVDVRAAIAWAKVPVVWFMVVWIPVVGIVMSMMGTAHTAAIIAQSILSIFFSAFGLWSFVLLCLALGEVHRFSAWKGFVAILIPGILLTIPATIVIGLVAAIVILNVIPPSV